MVKDILENRNKIIDFQGQIFYLYTEELLQIDYTL